jgi:RND family efflux transporter MFP subunit
MRRAFIGLGLVFLAFVAYRVVTTAKSRSAPTEKKADIPLVETARVERRDLVETVSVTGSVRPRNEVDVYAKVGGRIETLGVQVGDRVKAGQALASIEHREVAWKAKAASASEQVAKANLDGAKLELDRTEALFKGGSSPQSQLDSARVKYQLMLAQYAKEQASAGLAEQELANSRVDSPITGTITRRQINLGANVTATTILFTVQDVAALKLETSVDASAFARLRKGTEVQVQVDAYPSETFPGKVTVLSPSLDSQTRRAAMELEVDNSSGKLLPNMFAHASVKLGELHNVVAIPKEAVLEAPGGAIVYRVQDSSVKALRPQLGAEDHGFVAVRDGLSEGDQVAVSGLATLADGAAVRVSPSKTNAVSRNAP